MARQVSEAASALTEILATQASLSPSVAQEVTTFMSDLIQVQTANSQDAEEAEAAAAGTVGTNGGATVRLRRRLDAAAAAAAVRETEAAARSLSSAVMAMARLVTSGAPPERSDGGASEQVALRSPNLNLTAQSRPTHLLAAQPLSCDTRDPSQATSVSMPSTLLNFAEGLDPEEPILVVLYTVPGSLHPRTIGPQAHAAARNATGGDDGNDGDDGGDGGGIAGLESRRLSASSPLVAFSLSQRGVEVSIEGARQPVNVSVPFDLRGRAGPWSDAEFDVTSATLTGGGSEIVCIGLPVNETEALRCTSVVECHRWHADDASPTGGSWLTDDCETTEGFGVDGERTVQCSCGHLADLVAFEMPTGSDAPLAPVHLQMKTLTWRSWRCMRRFSLEADPVAWGVLLSLVSLWTIGLATAIYRDRQDIALLGAHVGGWPNEAAPRRRRVARVGRAILELVRRAPAAGSAASTSCVSNTRELQGSCRASVAEHSPVDDCAQPCRMEEHRAEPSSMSGLAQGLSTGDAVREPRATDLQWAQRPQNEQELEASVIVEAFVAEDPGDAPPRDKVPLLEVEDISLGSAWASPPPSPPPVLPACARSPFTPSHPRFAGTWAAGREGVCWPFGLCVSGACFSSFVANGWEQIALESTSRYPMLAGLAYGGQGGFTRAQTVQVLMNSLTVELVVLCMLFSARSNVPTVINLGAIVVSGILVAFICVPMRLLATWLFEPSIFVRLGRRLRQALALLLVLLLDVVVVLLDCMCCWPRHVCLCFHQLRIIERVEALSRILRGALKRLISHCLRAFGCSRVTFWRRSRTTFGHKSRVAFGQPSRAAPLRQAEEDGSAWTAVEAKQAEAMEAEANTPVEEWAPIEEANRTKEKEAHEAGCPSHGLPRSPLRQIELARLDEGSLAALAARVADIASRVSDGAAQADSSLISAQAALLSAQASMLSAKIMTAPPPGSNECGTVGSTTSAAPHVVSRASRYRQDGTCVSLTTRIDRQRATMAAATSPPTEPSPPASPPSRPTSPPASPPEPPEPLPSSTARSLPPHPRQERSRIVPRESSHGRPRAPSALVLSKPMSRHSNVQPNERMLGYSLTHSWAHQHLRCVERILIGWVTNLLVFGAALLTFALYACELHSAASLSGHPDAAWQALLLSWAISAIGLLVLYEPCLIVLSKGMPMLFIS